MRLPSLNPSLDLILREIVYRLACRHRQGPKPNILLYCSRRGGSTWLLNTLSAHPGMRQMGRPFLTLVTSRWRKRIPNLRPATEGTNNAQCRHIIHFEGEDEQRFYSLAKDVISGRIPIYPSLHMRAPYFHRSTDRIVLQMTSGTPLIEWFDQHFPIQTVILFRHPIMTALSVRREGWPHECAEFLDHPSFVDHHLTGKDVDRARAILENGSPLAHHVLDWSLKMLVPYRAWTSGKYPGWTVVTYEQTVTEPNRMVEELSVRLDLPEVDAMRRQIIRPSRTVSQETVSHVGDPAYLLERIRKHVSVKDEEELLAIPRSLGIDLYEPGRFMPLERYQI
jgi:hypothetical protein